MKILLSFVGEQDPISEKTSAEGSIVTLCRPIASVILGINQNVSLGTILSDLRDARNFSISAHGMRPVSYKEAEKSILLMRELINGLFFINQELDIYPFQQAAITEVLKILQFAFTHSNRGTPR